MIFNASHLAPGRLYKRLLPAQTRRTLRRLFDNSFCRHYPDKVTLGERCPWTILERGLNRNSIVYSGGAGEDISFELALIQRFEVTVQLYDPSPRLDAVTVTTQYRDKLRFKSLGLAASKGSVSFEPSDPGGTSGLSHLRKAAKSPDTFQLPCTSLQDEMKANGHSRIDLLKLDIEGFEYEVLESCLNSDVLPKQLCVEFHHFMEDMPKRTDTARLILRLIQRGYKLVHKTQYDYTFYSREHLRSRCGGDK